MWKLKIIDIFLGKEKTLPPMTKEQEMGLFSQLYENPTFRRYLDAREEYLVHNGMEQFILGKLANSNGLAGQLLEVRNLRTRARNAFLLVEKQRKSSLVKKQETPAS